jgi:hypothetical protein
VLHTEKPCQLVIMALRPKEEIGAEVHKLDMNSTVAQPSRAVRHALEAVDAACVDVARGVEESRRLTRGFVARTPWAKIDRNAILACRRSATRGR